MRFNCGPTKEERANERSRKVWLQAKRDREWHPVFAWRPVRDEITNTCLWLETVQRRRQVRAGYQWLEEYVFRATENV